MMDAAPSASSAAIPGWQHKAIAAGLSWAEAVLPARLRPDHDPASLMRATGARPLAGSVQGLLQLSEAIKQDTTLSLFGAVSLRWDFMRLLRNAEMIAQRHEAEPDLARQKITAPVFILGLPRSGTTFLHTLLAEDEANLVPRNWQTIYPRPRPANFDAKTSKAARRVDSQLRIFAALAPEFPAAHPITADSPQECSEITASVFQSLRFDTTFRVPGYRAWLDQRGHLEASEFHRKFLQVLQGGRQDGQWILKCPDHIFSIEAIRVVYPDARFVLVHRDPIKVFGSVAHLTEVLRAPFVKNVNPLEIGAQVTERWIEGASRLVAFDQREDVPASHKFHIRYDELVADPLAVVANLYRNFGMVFTPQTREAMGRALQAKPRGGYVGRRRYALGRFGIIPERVNPRFNSYLEYFGLSPQAAE